MAIYKTRTALKSFELSNGKTVDLIELIDALVDGGSWVDEMVIPTVAPEIGTVAYVNAMGAMRRGVVVKTTKTKTHVALTTQGAVDAAMRKSWGEPIRVQVVIADTNYVRVAPPAAPEFDPETGASAPEANRHMSQTGGVQELTPNSQAGKVGTMNNDAAQSMTEDDAIAAIRAAAEAPTTVVTIGGDEPETLDASSELAQSLVEADHAEAVAVEVVRETTGSAVVRLLERVHERIRQNHPEVPQVVIVTGAGTSLGSAKWGHFRPQGWMTKGDDTTKIHEMFMAGETLAKGARQVLQTMLHETAHALNEHRGDQDTSRQGRWHNKTFLKTAQEVGLEHRNPAADKAHGYSFVTLTDETVEEYADLLADLDREIHLMVRLPGWLGGDAGESGGEGMGKAPTKGTETSSSNLKLTCMCAEPNIIRASKKVADKLVVKCQDCEEFFGER